MKKIYNTPEYEIENFTIMTKIFTTSFGLLDGNTDIDLDNLTAEQEWEIGGKVF